jgi:hypothetical protein
LFSLHCTSLLYPPATEPLLIETLVLITFTSNKQFVFARVGQAEKLHAITPPSIALLSMASVYIVLLSVLEYNNQYRYHLNIQNILLLDEVYL